MYLFGRGVENDGQKAENWLKKAAGSGQVDAQSILSIMNDKAKSPLLDYIEEIDAERPDDFVTVVLPEFVPSRWWHHLLHNQLALFIKGALLFKSTPSSSAFPTTCGLEVSRRPRRSGHLRGEIECPG